MAMTPEEKAKSKAHKDRYYQAGISCPKCHVGTCSTSQSRGYRRRSEVTRIRTCRNPECKYSFRTIESCVIRGNLFVIKKDKRSQPFDRNKMVNSMKKALYGRQVSDERLAHAVDAICNQLDVWDAISEKRVMKNSYIRVTSQMIGSLVIESLREIDIIGYIRYVSIFRKFYHPDDFRDLFDKMGY